jgi:putative phosphoesterase
MKIGVISDTHDRLESIVYLKKIFIKEKIEMIIHCGDWVSPFTLEFFDVTFSDFQVPVKSVFGNNEGDIKRIIERNANLINPIEFAPKDVLEIELSGRKIAVYHGHDQLVLRALILSSQYDAIFTGHTHEVRNEIIGLTLVLNPGSTCFAAKSNLLEKSSVAVYDTDANTAELYYFSRRELS